MSSNDASKRRKLATNNNSNGAGTMVARGMEDLIAEMRLHLTSLQTKMNEMETNNISMQNEIDSTKSRLLQMNELDKKNKYLEARCSSLERSVKILVKEQKWEYSAPDIPDSYWTNCGFDEGYIAEMKQSLRQIKQTTCDLRNDEVGGKGIILGEGIDIVLLYDDALIPHWKELINAMQLYQEEEPLEITIYNLQLSASVIDLLLPMLKHKPVISIELQNNSFVNGREGIGFAVEVMKSNRMMKGFHWYGNAINSMEDAQRLIEAIIRHPSLNRISLDSFAEDINGYDVLCSLLAGDKNFTEIDFERNYIRTGGDTAISDYLATNPPLKKLFLASNHLNDEDARLVARALKRNTNLEYLRVMQNDITEIGRDALCDAIYDPTSLNSMSDCNHTCIVSGIDFGDIPVNLYTSTPLDNRKQKLYYLLSLRNREGSNVRHLNSEFRDEDEDEIILKLVPRVLESVHRYSNEYRPSYTVRPLSITYEILRGWKMPELYEQR